MKNTISLFIGAALLAACNAETGPGGAAAPPAAVAGQKVLPASDARSPGKPAAPVTIRYRVLGTPYVGQPVAIEIELLADGGVQPLRLSYAINDPDSLLFAADEPREIELGIDAESGSARRQVTVVPQREGRLYLNVTAEVATEAGALLKSMSIPLAVGRADVEAEVNGELQQGPDGETVISMPAGES